MCRSQRKACAINHSVGAAISASAATKPIPANSIASIVAAKNAPDVPMKSMNPDPTRPIRITCTAVDSPAVSSVAETRNAAS